MGCINSKATVHPASLDDDDDDVVVSRPSVSPPAQDGAGDAVAQLNEKIAKLNGEVAVAEAGKASSEEARAVVEAALAKVQDHVLLDRTLPSEMQITILNTELQKLQPYGAPDAAPGVGGGGGGARLQRPSTAARFEETAKAQANLIGKLEDDVKKSQAEIKVLKNKYERKIKKVRVSSAKQRTENALQVFELKDQLAAMKKEYASLELVLVKKEREVAASALKAREAGEEVASLRGSSATGRSRKANAAAAATATPGNDSADEEDPVEVAHGNLVVQLSMQIADLDGELEEANTIIAQLRAAAGGGGGAEVPDGAADDAAACVDEEAGPTTTRWQSAA